MEVQVCVRKAGVSANSSSSSAYGVGALHRGKEELRGRRLNRREEGVKGIARARERVRVRVRVRVRLVITSPAEAQS